MDLFERAILLAIGGAIGFVLGYIVRSLRVIQEEVHVVKDIAEHGTPPRKDDETGAARLPSWNNIALGLVVLLTAYAAITSQIATNNVEKQAQKDQVSRCEAGVDGRNVQRELVEAVYVLATGAADTDVAQLTPTEVQQYNAYINRANLFRSEMYSKIKPSPGCAKYVEDDNVQPPTEAFPLIQIPKE